MTFETIYGTIYGMIVGRILGIIYETISYLVLGLPIFSQTTSTTVWHYYNYLLLLWSPFDLLLPSNASIHDRLSRMNREIRVDLQFTRLDTNSDFSTA